MKKARLVLVIIACGACLHGTSYAGPPTRGAEPPHSPSNEKAASDRSSNSALNAAAKDEDYSAEEELLHRKRLGSHPLNKNDRASHTLNKNDKAGHDSVTKATHQPVPIQPRRLEENQAAKNHLKNTPGNAAEVHHPGPGNSAVAAKRAVAENNTDKNRSLSIRPPGVVALGSSPFNTARGRSELTVLGGPVMSTAKATASIGGAKVRNRTR